MEPLEEFETVFHSVNPSYTAQHVDTITKHRRDLGNKLFFDMLLAHMNQDQAIKLYPPKSAAEMHKLYTRISHFPAATLQRRSLVYYLMLDLAGSSENALKYASRFGLPQKYITLMDGFWHMDQLEFKRALDNLTAPSLIPTLTDETLQVLCDHPKSDPSLALGYYYTVAPIIKEPEVFDKVFRCMVLSSVTEAFFFARQQGGAMHRHLFSRLIRDVLVSQGDSIKAQMAEELVGLPFNNEEEAWFQELLSTGGLQGFSEAKDVLIVRSIIKGNLGQAEELATTARDKPIDGLSWTSLLQSARS